LWFILPKHGSLAEFRKAQLSGVLTPPVPSPTLETTIALVAQLSVVFTRHGSWAGLPRAALYSLAEYFTADPCWAQIPKNIIGRIAQFLASPKKVVRMGQGH
jgi:hypothetical protein